AQAPNGARYVITAGHCTANGVAWYHGTTHIGTTQHSHASGNVDVARINISNSSWNGTPWGKIYNFSCPYQGCGGTSALNIDAYVGQSGVAGYSTGQTACLAGAAVRNNGRPTGLI